MKSHVFNFKRGFGWGELIALFALVLSVAGYITAKIPNPSPNIIVTQAERSPLGFREGVGSHFAFSNNSDVPLRKPYLVLSHLALKPEQERMGISMEPPYEYQHVPYKLGSMVKFAHDIPAHQEIMITFVKDVFSVTLIADNLPALYVPLKETETLKEQ